MIPFEGPALPASAGELEASIARRLEQWFAPSDRRIVRVEDERYPRLRAVRIDLCGARLTVDPASVVPRDVRGTGDSIEVNDLHVEAAPIEVSGRPIEFRLRARDARLEVAVAAGGRSLLRPVAGVGTLSGSVRRDDLEDLVRGIVEPHARAKGVVVERVAIDLVQRGARGVLLTSRVRVRKVIAAEVIVSAAAEVDAALHLVVHDVDARAEGMIGALLRGALERAADRVRGQRIPLTALPVGSLRLADVQVEVRDGIAVAAAFGP